MDYKSIPTTSIGQYMYIRDVYHMLSDKMSINYSNQLFVPTAIVFCFLSSFIYTLDSYNNTDSRWFEKNLAVSKHENNSQRLPNYNWKPPDKYYSPSEKSTQRNTGMEFTTTEDSEQRMVDLWLKKMQEISRQEREKWAAYRRNVKLTLNNVEESAEAKELMNNESITSSSANQERDVEDNFSSDRFHFFSSNSNESNTNIDGILNKKVDSSEKSSDISNSSEEVFQKANSTHQRNEDYEIFDIEEDLSFEQKMATNNKKSKIETDYLSSIINSFPKQPILQLFNNTRIFKNNTYKNLADSSENDKNSTKKYVIQLDSSQDSEKKDTNDNKEIEKETINLSIEKNKKNDNLLSEKAILQKLKIINIPINKNSFKLSENIHHLNQLNFKVPLKKYFRYTQNNNVKNNEDNKKDDEKTRDVKSLMWKSKEEKYNVDGKDVIRIPNHERSFYSGRWGMSVTSPPVDFLKDMFRRSMRRKNEKQLKKDEKLFNQGSTSVASSSEEFFEDQEYGIEFAKTGSKSNEIKISVNDQSIRRNLQTLPQQLVANKKYKKFVEILFGKIPNANLYDSKYSSSSYMNNYPTSTEFNNGLFLGFLYFTLPSYIWQNNMDIPMSCCIQIPFVLFPI